MCKGLYERQILVQTGADSPKLLSVQVMELLVSLCSVPVLRKLVCETVLRPPAPRIQPGTRKGVQARGSEPSLALVHWVTSPLDGPEQCYMQALSLLTELFEVRWCFFQFSLFAQCFPNAQVNNLNVRRELPWMFCVQSRDALTSHFCP